MLLLVIGNGEVEIAISNIGLHATVWQSNVCLVKMQLLCVIEV